jgi:hypothetical protein
MAFIQFIRVRDLSTGHEYDVPESAVDLAAHEVLTKYPANLTGIPRPAKHRTDKGGQPAEVAPKPARKRAARKPSTTKATAPAATEKEK